MPAPAGYSAATLRDFVGHDFGASAPVVVGQPRIDGFAEVTGDDQWIHVDVERARAESPFGGPVAHGFLTLSLLPMLASQLFVIEHRGAKLNYGVNKVRFPAPVKVGSKIRAQVTIGAVEPVAVGKRVTLNYVVEVDGQERPAMVAESVVVILAADEGAGSRGA